MATDSIPSDLELALSFDTDVPEVTQTREGIGYLTL